MKNRRGTYLTRLLSARKWAALAALAMGTSFQLTSCREETGMFVTRTIFSSVFLPINNMIILFFDLLITTISQSLPI